MKKYDVLLVGGGIMSFTLAKLLTELNPEFQIGILESRQVMASESSFAWHNAGTGHAGLCELNFTPEINGKIDIEKALHVTESFEISKQFWAYLVDKKGYRANTFINKIPHISYVDNYKDVEFLKKRYDVMRQHHFYDNMQYIDNYRILCTLLPLMMSGELKSGTRAATYSECGTDLNYSNLTHLMQSDLLKNLNVDMIKSRQVTDIKREGKYWKVYAKNTICNVLNTFEYEAEYVFIGAGGATINLLEKANIKECKGYAGFPVSGQFLRCINPDVIARHNAKVYGKASIGAPPMSVPHLDTRIIDGEKQLLFGPFAGFTTKFLKNGSKWDFFKSIRLNNLYPMVMAGLRNIPLTKYLIKEVSRGFDGKMGELKRYYPEANPNDWELYTAGQRVQIIKPDANKGGVIEFGTEVVATADGTLSGLLGASPGASTSVDIMIKLIENCFPQMQSEEWISKMRKMIPSYKQSLINNEPLYRAVRAKTDQILFKTTNYDGNEA